MKFSNFISTYLYSVSYLNIFTNSCTFDRIWQLCAISNSYEGEARSYTEH